MPHLSLLGDNMRLPQLHPSSSSNFSLLWRSLIQLMGLRCLNISTAEKKWMQRWKISASPSLNRIEKVPRGIEIDASAGQISRLQWLLLERRLSVVMNECLWIKHTHTHTQLVCSTSLTADWCLPHEEQWSPLIIHDVSERRKKTIQMREAEIAW